MSSLVLGVLMFATLAFSVFKPRQILIYLAVITFGCGLLLSLPVGSLWAMIGISLIIGYAIVRSLIIMYK